MWKLILQNRTLLLVFTNFYEVFGGGTRLAMPKTICAPDTSSLKTGSGATEGVQDYGVLGRPGYVIWAGLVGHENTRRKTFPICPDGTLLGMEGKHGVLI